MQFPEEKVYTNTLMQEGKQALPRSQRSLYTLV